MEWVQSKWDVERFSNRHTHLPANCGIVKHVIATNNSNIEALHGQDPEWILGSSCNVEQIWWHNKMREQSKLAALQRACKPVAEEGMGTVTAPSGLPGFNTIRIKPGDGDWDQPQSRDHSASPQWWDRSQVKPERQVFVKVRIDKVQDWVQTQLRCSSGGGGGQEGLLA